MSGKILAVNILFLLIKNLNNIRPIFAEEPKGLALIEFRTQLFQ